MTALWGSRGPDARPLQARCGECAWQGPERWEPDADAVMLAASDCHEHNTTAHPEPVLVDEGMLF